MSVNDPKVKLNLAAALAAEMCEAFGYGLVAEALWRIPVRFAVPFELEPGTLAACLYHPNGYLEIAVVSGTYRRVTESVLALFLIHEGVHVVDPQWRRRHASASRAEAAEAKAELDADGIAIDVGQKWVEQLLSLKRFEEARELDLAIEFLRDHRAAHRDLFVRKVQELMKAA